MVSLVEVRIESGSMSYDIPGHCKMLDLQLVIPEGAEKVNCK